MSKFRFSLEGGDITSISPESWEKLQKAIGKALDEAGADGLRVTGFQMPDDFIENFLRIKNSVSLYFFIRQDDDFLRYTLQTTQK